MAVKTESQSLKVDLEALPHNGRDVVYTDPETGNKIACQIELERLPEGQIPDIDAKPFNKKADHHANDFGWYFDEDTQEWVAKIGGQHLLIRMALKYKRFVAPVGRRFGKTTSVFFLLLIEAGMTPGKYYSLVVCPSHDKAYELMEFCAAMWGGKPGEKDEDGNPVQTIVTKFVGGPKDQRRYLELKPIDNNDTGEQVNTGSRIYFVSGGHPHYKRIRGYPHPIHRVIVDEFAQAHPGLWPVVNHMLADDDGHGLFIGTTDVEEIGNHLFHTFFLWGVDTNPKRASWAAMNFPSFANPHLSETGLAEVEAGCVTEEDRLQEVYGKFLTDRGAVFQNLPACGVLPYVMKDDPIYPDWLKTIESRAIAALGKAKDTSRKPPEVWFHQGWKRAHTFAISSDWAKDRDHTVISIFDLTTMKQVLIVRFHGQNWPEQYVWAQHLHTAYNCVIWHGDENTGAGQAIGDIMRSEHGKGIYAHKFNVYNKSAYVHRLQRIFLERGVRLINCFEQMQELRQFMRHVPDETKGQKMVRYGHPPGGNDDFVDTILQMSETIMLGEIAAVEEAQPDGKYIANDRGGVSIRVPIPDLDDEGTPTGML